MMRNSSRVGGERSPLGTLPRKRSETRWPWPRSCMSRPSSRISEPMAFKWCSWMRRTSSVRSHCAPFEATG
eukprot:scaffold190151_cov31-Tisochrysis_lutea.AAC.3